MSAPPPNRRLPAAASEAAADASETERLAAEGPALPRLWRGFTRARVFFGVMLVLLQAVTIGLGQPAHPLSLALVGAYLLATLLATRIHPRALPLSKIGLTWLATIGVDLATFALVQTAQQGNINYTPLFALPVLMSAVLGTRLLGLGTTAGATLLLLAEAGSYWMRADGEPSARFVQAALTGTGLFVMALLAHEIALRLARQEALAQRSRIAAEMQARVNGLVIETLSEGVLVVDARGYVRAANPAVSGMLDQPLRAAQLPVHLGVNPAWQGLARLAQATFRQQLPQSIELPMAQSHGGVRELRVTTRLTGLDASAGQPRDAMCVMFLEDLRDLEARVRTEKLAAMGRMSAAVAQEIRNPLAAITQASSLLDEDLSDPAQRQLLALVLQNAQRLSRIVDDVLDVARARQQRALVPSDAVALDATVRALAEEWVGQTGRHGVLMALQAMQCDVRFESEHLRRILVNLLDNAARYAGARDGSIQVGTRALADGRASLQVWSDGAPLEAAVQAHLFEPFFSSEARSSGLGLFICRELCERHGATIGHQRRSLSPGGPEGNEFVISFATAPAPL
ncbi:MAG: ATP-binding protein [Variovorax sp.]